MSADHLADLSGYVSGVIAEDIPACRWVRLACERHRADLERAEAGDWDYVFDASLAIKAVRYIELMPHVKDEWRGKRIQLEPWQKFIVGSLYGWVHRGTRYRRFRHAYICVPRKNAKSTLAAGIGLYMLTADREPGAEVYSGATSEDQAMEVFRPAREMARILGSSFSAPYGLTVGAKHLETRDGSRFRPVIGKPGDGASPHCAIIDEYHEHQSDALYETMVTGMVARRQPLALVITTAGADISGPCYAMQKDVQRLLDGQMQQEDLFGIIYTIDQEDDWSSPDALRKANPNFGVSVRQSAVESAQRAAVESSRKQAAFKTKHLNVWVTSRDAWMNMKWWERQADRSLAMDDFSGEPCWMGLDLGAKYDLTAIAVCFRRQIDDLNHYYLFVRHYCPRDTADDPEKRHYQGWISDGHMTATDGDIIDFERIESDIADIGRTYEIQEIAYDPWGATQTAQRLQDQHGLPVVEVAQTTRQLSEPMKMMEALTRTGRLHHDGNPCLAWGVSNVTIKEDANENIFPRKDNRESKIDGAVAAIMALGRALSEDVETLNADQVLYV